MPAPRSRRTSRSAYAVPLTFPGDGAPPPRDPHRTQAAPVPCSHRTPAHRPGAPDVGPHYGQNTGLAEAGLNKRVTGPRGDSMSKLPDRMWRLPRHEDDEAAGDEGIGRILALSDGVFAIAITL